eukprot:m.157146 g.157146  ORF g.157146 m.157146 type:complete len:186 (-) comp15110_c0_seq1:28-585(-)
MDKMEGKSPAKRKYGPLKKKMQLFRAGEMIRDSRSRHGWDIWSPPNKAPFPCLEGKGKWIFKWGEYYFLTEGPLVHYMMENRKKKEPPIPWSRKINHLPRFKSSQETIMVILLCAERFHTLQAQDDGAVPSELGLQCCNDVQEKHPTPLPVELWEFILSLIFDGTPSNNIMNIKKPSNIVTRALK